MANFIKKVILLSLLLIIVFAVYLTKNQDLRENLLIRLGLAASKDFRVPEDIKIGMEDINVDRLNLEEEKAAEEPEETTTPFAFEEVEEPEVQVPSSTEVIVEEEGVGVGSVEAWEDSPSLSLEEIGEQVAEIAKQVELISEEVDILIAMNEVKQDIKNLSNQAGELDLDCSTCNNLSSN